MTTTSIDYFVHRLAIERAEEAAYLAERAMWATITTEADSLAEMDALIDIRAAEREAEALDACLDC